MGTNDLLENLSVKRKSCRKVVEIRMDECRSLDVNRCVFEGKSSMNLREGSVWGACGRWFESSHPDLKRYVWGACGRWFESSHPDLKR